MSTKPNTDISSMSARDIANTLDSLIFTAAHDWARSIRIDMAARDLIVAAIRHAYPASTK
jgi:hypothetical protein